MSDEVVLGSTSFTLVSKSRKWSKENGYYTEEVWSGPQSGGDAHEAVLQGRGADATSKSTGVPCVVTGQFPDGTGSWDEDTAAIANATWELIPEIFDKRLESFGMWNQNPENIAKVNKMIRAGTVTTDALQELGDDWVKFGGLKTNGTESFRFYAYRVRQTITTSRKSTLAASFADSGTVISWADIGVPASARFAQPSVMVYKYDVGWSVESLDEWYVDPPTVIWVKGQRKWKIVNEWLGQHQWSGTLYYGGSGTP